MKNYLKTAATKSPLLVFTVCAILLGGGVGAAIYWASGPLTRTITIEGYIDACSSFVPNDLIGVTSYAELEAKCTTEMNAVIRVASDGSNADSCWTSLNIQCPGSSTVMATANVYTLTNGVCDAGVELGTIATDGTEFVQVISYGNPIWFYESDYAAGVVHVLYFLLDWDIDPNLCIGEHVFTATVSLGEN